MNTKTLTKALMKGNPPLKQPKAGDFLGTGSTLLNLGFSGRPAGGLAKGYYYFFVGDSSALKTWTALNCLAEAANNKSFDSYTLVYDPVEQGALMDVSQFFGTKLAARMKLPPRGVSYAAEDFYYNFDDLVKAEKPFIYVLDSENSLVSEAADEKFESNSQASLKGKEGKGSYGDGKAKLHSENMRRVVAQLRDTNSILIVLSQTRDNINAIGWGDTKTRSGGRSLKFYATCEIWFSRKGSIKRRVRGIERKIGSTIKVDFKKNRFYGFEGSIDIDHYRSVGIDDVGSNIKFLVNEGHWKSSSAGIKAPEFKRQLSFDDLVRYVERKNLEIDLAGIVQEVWEDIEKSCAVERKQRYQ